MKNKKSTYVVFLIFMKSERDGIGLIKIKSIIYDKMKAFKLGDYYLETYKRKQYKYVLGKIYDKVEFKSAGLILDKIRRDKAINNCLFKWR